MSWMNSIISWLKDIEDYFYDAYREVYDWVYPFWLLAFPLLYASRGFGYLAYYFSLFNNWLVWADARIDEILSSVDILGLLRPWLNYAEDAWDWVRNAFSNVWYIVNDWWSSAMVEVQGWIEEAVSGVRTLVDQANTWLASLQSAWDDFKGMIPTIDEVIHWWHNWTGYVLSVVNTWWTGALVEVQSLIDSAFVTREQFWDGWQDWRDKVTEFFTDPEEWLYKAADRIIERFW